MENIKIHKSDDFVSGIFRSSPSEVLKKILVLNFFKNPRKYILESSPPFKKVFEYLRMATSGGSDDKICFSIITGPLNPVLEKTIIAKFEMIENFYSDLPRINIGWKSND